MDNRIELFPEKICAAVENAEHPLPPPPGMFDPTSVMALFMVEPEIRLLFIRKADTKTYTWANQMAFPGGHKEKTDASTRHTALRELKEEVGIDSSNVRMIGSLGHFQTLNNKDIEAWAGIWNQNDTLVIDRDEIARVYKIPLDHLIKCHMGRGFFNKEVDIMQLVYPYKDARIWGVTAKILAHLLNLILNS